MTKSQKELIKKKKHKDEANVIEYEGEKSCKAGRWKCEYEDSRAPSGAGPRGGRPGRQAGPRAIAQSRARHLTQAQFLETAYIFGPVEPFLQSA